MEKVFIAGLHLKSTHRDETRQSMEELALLAESAGVCVDEIFIQSLTKVQSATYLGKGKLAEIKDLAEQRDITTIIFDDNLSPAQARNISDFTRCNVVDRTELILDIFSRHARTKQAKLQVELAQLQYSYSRLKNMWKHLSRIKGGIGFRGPGETQIEVDRREIQKKITILNNRLNEIEKVAHNKRKRRQNIISVALVGYTNAGKSTLFNALTDENRYAANQLFATLDAKTRSMFLPASNKQVVLTDTIGFIKKLPHDLVSSFHTTLMEVNEADLLLHVVDISHPLLDDYIESVEDVLREIKAFDKNILLVFNKVDALKSLHHKFLIKDLKSRYTDSVFISAKTGENLDGLIEKINSFVISSQKLKTLKVPMAMQSLTSFLHKNAEIIDIDYDGDEQIINLRIEPKLYQNVLKQIQDYKIKEQYK